MTSTEPVPAPAPVTAEPAPVEPVPVEAVRALARAARILERALGDLSLAQYRVLAAVAAGDERASRIAARLALGKPAISASVEVLCRRGLLTRSEVASDQRAAALGLTEQGRHVLAAAERAMAERIGLLAARTPDPRTLLGALTWLDGAIDAALADAAAAGSPR